MRPIPPLDASYDDAMKAAALTGIPLARILDGNVPQELIGRQLAHLGVASQSTDLFSVHRANQGLAFLGGASLSEVEAMAPPVAQAPSGNLGLMAVAAAFLLAGGLK